MKNLTIGGLRAPGGFRGPRFQKFKKPRIQNDGPNTHPKFQHSSSIFRGPPPRGPPENPPGGFQGAPISKIQKIIIGKVILKAHAKFHWNRSILRWLKVGGTEMSGGEEGEEEDTHSTFILGIFRTVIKIEPN